MIGPRGVGKSTIIERGLKKSTSTIIASDNQQNQSARPRRRSELICAVTSYRAVLVSGGRERTIEVLEVDSALMQYDDGGIRWPKYLPVIDGALICYDATVSGGLQSLTQVLGASRDLRSSSPGTAGFWTRGTAISLAVVGNKVSTDDRSNRVNSRVAADQASVYNAGLILFDGGKDDQKKQQQVFQWLVQQVDKKRGACARQAMNLTVQATSTATRPALARLRGRLARPTRRRQSGTRPRASARSSTRRPTPRTVFRRDQAKTWRPLSRCRARSGSSRVRPSRRGASRTPVPRRRLLCRTRRHRLPRPIRRRRPRRPTRCPSRSRAPGASSISSSVATRSSTSSCSRASRPMVRATEPVHELMPADEAFVAMFLIVYRRFARPGDVLAKLIERYEYISARLEVEPLLSRYAHMRCVPVRACALTPQSLRDAAALGRSASERLHRAPDAGPTAVLHREHRAQSLGLALHRRPAPADEQHRVRSRS